MGSGFIVVVQLRVADRRSIGFRSPLVPGRCAHAASMQAAFGATRKHRSKCPNDELRAGACSSWLQNYTYRLNAAGFQRRSS